MRECTGRRIETIEAPTGPDPEETVSIFMNEMNRAVA
jgi:hypothetical protein